MKAIIFDFDGVIVDSEPLRYKTYRTLFKKNFGINLPSKPDNHILGRTQRENIKYFMRKYNLDGDIEKLIKERNLLLDKVFTRKNVKPIEDIISLIRFLKSKGYKIAVASSSNRIYVKRALDYLNLSFDLIVTGEMVKHSKPHPEIFLLTAKLLKEKPKDCLVFEDSDNGITSAKRAGMQVIKVMEVNKQ